MKDNQENSEENVESLKDKVMASLKEERKTSDYPTEKEQENTADSYSDKSATQTAEETTSEPPLESAVGRRTNRQATNKKKPELPGRKKEDRLVKRIVWTVLGVLLVCMLVFGFSVYRYISNGLQPLNKKDNALVQVHVPIGSSNKQIGEILQTKKVISSGLVFSYYTKMKNYSDFQAGYYQMAPSMTLDQLASLLKEGGSAEPTALADAKIQIPEGYSADQIAAVVAKKTKYTKAEFLAVLNNQTFLNKMAKKYPDLLSSAMSATNVRYRLEGYLFPATYNYYKKESLEAIVEKMLIASNDVLKDRYDAIKERKMTVQQTLTLASLVEKEGVTDTDRAKIAQVFYNRFAENMPLQSDISVMYALNTHKEQLSNKDTQVDSPYNLYVNKGYGPGPFNNPSEKAINAVLNPNIDEDALYFLADLKTGKVYYAKTYEEHQKNVEKYINND